MRAIVYYRVSKKTTRDNIETQKSEMIPWIETLKEKKGYEIPGDFIFEEERSGEEIDKRPKFMKVLDLLESGEVQVLIVYMVDRIGRFKDRADRNRVMELIINKEVSVETLYDDSFDPRSEDDMDELEKLLTDARRENRRRAIRIRGGLVKAAKKGRKLGSAPYGINWNEKEGRYEINPDELRGLRKIFELLPDIGLVKTANFLNSDLKKYPPRRSEFWDYTTIRGFVHNDFYYLGKIRSKHGLIDTKLEPFYTMEEVLRVRNLIYKRRKKTEDAKPTDGFLLHGLARCGICGCRLGVHDLPGGKGRRKRDYRYYRCRKGNRIGRPRCDFKGMDADRLDLDVWKGFVKELGNPEELAERIRRQELLPDKNREELEAQVKQSLKWLENLKAEEERLTHMRIKGRIPEDIHTKEHDRIVRERGQAEDMLRKAQNSLDRPSEVSEAIRLAAQFVADTVKRISEDRMIRTTPTPGIEKERFQLKRAALEKYIAAEGEIKIHPDRRIEIVLPIMVSLRRDSR